MVPTGGVRSSSRVDHQDRREQKENMLTLFVTGASGFVGLNLVEHLLTLGREVTAFSFGPLPEFAERVFAPLPGTLTVVEGDVLDESALRNAMALANPRVVIHGAALTPGPLQEPDVFQRTLAVNVLGTAGVLEAARRQGVERVVHLSSGSVFGANAKAAPLLDEEHPDPKPESVYSIAKYAGERAALRFAALHEMPVVVARLGAVFGAWEYATGLRETLSPLLGATLLALRGEEVVLSDTGEADWVYSRDVATALSALAGAEGSDAKRPSHALYHIGSGMKWSVADWCAAMEARKPGFRWRVAEQGEAANVEVYAATMRSPLDTTRLATDMGVKARFGLPESLTDYLNWFEGGGLEMFAESPS